jgi:WD40 repeat protein
LEAQNALHATLSQPGIQYASLPHGGRINHIAWSKQADVLLTSSDDGAVRIWDAVTLSESLRVKHDDSVNTATWSHDETRILSASDDGTARIWDASSGQLELSLTHGNPVIDAAWNSSEELIATLSGNDVIIWDGASGQRLHILNRDNHISEILWSNTGRFLLISTQASGGGGGVTDLWFADTQEIRRLQEKNIVTAQWSQDDSRLLTGDVEGNVQMWDVPTRRELKSFQHEAQIMTLDWSNSEQSILASSLDDKVQVWDVQTGEVVLALEAGDFAQWNEDESEILTEGYSSGYYRIAVWDAVSGEELVSLRNQDYGGDLRWNDSGRLIAATDYWSWEVRLFCAEQQPEEDLFSHDSQVFEAEYNSSGQQILSVSADQIARVWDVESGTIALELIHAYSDEVDSLEFESTLQDAYWSPSEEQILTTGRGITKVWDGKSGEILFEFAGESYAKYSHDGAYFATTNVADKVWIRDSITGTNTNHLTHRGYLVTDMLWSPNDQRIAILSHTPQFFDRTFGLWIWNLQTSTTTLLRAEDTPFDVIWSKDGKRLLARIGYFDTTINRVEIWNSESGDTISAIYEGPPISTAKWNRNERRVLLVPEDNGEVAVIDLFSNERVLTFTVPSVVLYAEWSPDERHVLTSSSDGTIRMWDGDTGELVSEVKSNVYNPVWRGDGKRFLAIREQSQINTFYVVEQELRTAACDRLGRNLTWLEWQQYFPAEPYRQTCPNLPVHFTVPEESRP